MTMDPAHGFLEEASDTMKARAQLRDAQGGERSMARTVAIFNAWTGNNISEDDGWRFMIALKQAREVQGKYNRDDYVDLAAYCGLLGEFESQSRPHPTGKTPVPTPFPQIKDAYSFIKDQLARGATTGIETIPTPVLSNAVYELSGSATSQVHSYSPKEPVGVPYGAISLGSALNEE